MPWIRRIQRHQQRVVPRVCVLPAASPHAAFEQHIQQRLGPLSVQHMHNLGSWQHGTVLVATGTQQSSSDAPRTLLGYGFLVPVAGGWSLKRSALELRSCVDPLTYRWARLPGPWLGLPRAVLVYGLLQAPMLTTIEVTFTHGKPRRWLVPAPLFGIVVTRATGVRTVQRVEHAPT